MTMQTAPPYVGGEQKITTRHHERLAIVYVRQSTIHQVQRHRESTQLQYGLVDLASRLGWPRERVLVIDDDLGMSGASAEGRAGFQRLLGEVALDHVGMILGVEMSRLARSCKDWYHLLELCALFGTLICDLDGLYDPSAYNDRLLLGLKGTMSEAELHIIGQRMLQGSQQKARRGELVTRLPIGYLRDLHGHVGMDPDEQVRAAVHAVFELFGRVGTVSGVLKYMRANGIPIGVRIEGGPDRGQLSWRRANQTTLRNILSHPIYAGAYVYGRRGRRKRPDGRGRRVWLPSDKWQVLLHDRMPAYIPWDRYQANLEQMRQNRSIYAARTSIRRGRALLPGLVVCGRCGYRMFTRYAGKASQPRYCCHGATVVYGERNCQSLSAAALDVEVVRLALMAMEPAALELSLHVAADLQAQHDQTESARQKCIERAQYETNRARRQYDAVEPENRLVARTLEKQWEQKLQTHRQLLEEHERFMQQQPRLLTAQEQARIRTLASDLPTLWHSKTTSDEERKAILRQIIDKVVVNVEENTEWIEAHVAWSGGQQTYSRLRRPVARLQQLSNWSTIRQRVCELKDQRMATPKIAEQLNHEGFRTTHGEPFSAGSVQMWLSRYQRHAGTGLRQLENERLEQDEWIVSDLARHLDVNRQTIYVWIRKGRIVARQIGSKNGLWVVKADAVRLRELTACRQSSLKNLSDETLRSAPQYPQTVKVVSGGAL
ncbi:recombinase family protein [cyanobacterium TDX16]|nr:recombinase family protein [cyanobacterium TDX16]